MSAGGPYPDSGNRGGSRRPEVNDYIYTKLANERANTLRAEAKAERAGKEILARRTDSRPHRETRRARRSLRSAH